MGTNYYLLGKPSCSHCGRGPGRGLHIGTSSAGWAFSLHVYPHDHWRVEDFDTSIKCIETLEDWLPLFDRFGVINEYEATVSSAAMIATITERKPWQGGQPLRRGDIDGYHTIAHGPGTWDLCTGEFS